VGQSGARRLRPPAERRLDKARVVVDAQGRPIGPARVVRVARPASGLQLTIDLRLQRAAEKAVQDGIALAHANGHYDAHAGAAVVMNPRDGSVYALASYPRFNQARAATDPEYLRSLFNPNDPRHLLVNRATQGVYPTGSTFKPIVAEAGLASGLISPYSTLALHGHVHGRQPRLPQRRVERQRQPDAAAGTLDLLRHLVLPPRFHVLRRAAAGAPLHAGLGEAPGRRDTPPASTSPVRLPASYRLPRG
jgi:cell division protein FtsI/penicillin-binding protein 2